MELMPMIFFISLLIVLTGLSFRKMEEFFLTEPLLAMVLGILAGPVLLNLLSLTEPAQELKVLKTTTEFTMAMALMAAALRLPKAFLKRNTSAQAGILLLGMLAMWLSSTIFLKLIFGNLGIGECLLLAAIITPTDPVVASTITTGEKAEKYLPAKIRHSLTFEAGANDGLAFPLIMGCILMLERLVFPLQEWFLKNFLYETLGAILISFVIGTIAGKAMHAAHQAKYMNKKSLLPFSLALALLLLSGLNLLNMNGIIGVFVGGLAFANKISKNEDLQEEEVQESMERIFIIPVFFIFGMILPWEAWIELGRKGIAIVVGILLFRRIPAFLLMVPWLKNFKGKIREAAIMGWFGPIGVAAMFYGIFAMEKTGLAQAWVIPSLIIFSSTFIHGVSSLPVERWYFKKGKEG